MTRNRLSALDAAFLSLESADAPMHVGWAAVFAPRPDGSRPDFEAVLTHIESRLGRAPRYRQRLLEIPLGLDDPVWVDDPDFDLSRHVLKAPNGDFASLVDEVMSTPLEHGRPLWELWIAERLDDGRIGVVGKAHHCLVDGLAAVELMSLLLDVTTDPEPVEPDDWTPEEQPGSIELVGEAIGHQLGQALDLGLVPLGWARNPARLLDLPGQAWSAARAVVHAAMPLAAPSRMNGAMTGRRHLALLSRPLEDLRTIKNHFGTTINDVLLSASAGGLRDLLEDRDDPSREIKAMVPVSVQDPDERWGNGIAFLFLPLPIDEADPVWRLRDIHVAMRERKREHEPEGSDAVLGALSLAPRRVRRLASRVLASPALSNLTISNIPGPRVPLYLLGCEAVRAYPVVPLTGGHGISIGMTTVHDEACFGVYAQAELAQDADRIAAGIDAAIDELLALTAS
ncbi:MAG TPA: wax ester/triacylglycerol synthase family O-acyltransferase [Solirubrobacteraceae bacterium]|jgi:WS/DGAT/MGAT family acyltransferase|nr:wax ester/triacylglycerol synthase family O-acyltransferase [Solirubrobacteraceae bacterium]